MEKRRLLNLIAAILVAVGITAGIVYAVNYDRYDYGSFYDEDWDGVVEKFQPEQPCCLDNSWPTPCPEWEYEDECDELYDEVQVTYEFTPLGCGSSGVTGTETYEIAALDTECEQVADCTGYPYCIFCSGSNPNMGTNVAYIQAGLCPDAETEVSFMWREILE